MDGAHLPPAVRRAPCLDLHDLRRDRHGLGDDFMPGAEVVTRHEAAQIIAALASAFPAFPPARETVAVYVEALSDLDYADTVAATHDLIRLEDRFPSVAAIRRRVGHRTGLLAPTAAQAWDEVNRQASDGGRSRVPSWTHPAVAETVRAVGWFSLCSSTNPETMRAQFLRLYDDTRRRHDDDLMVTTGALAPRQELTA